MIDVPLTMETCDSSSTYQQWYKTGDNNNRLKNVGNSNKYLGIKGGCMNNEMLDFAYGTKVQGQNVFNNCGPIDEYDGTTIQEQQEWKFLSDGEGSLIFTHGARKYYWIVDNENGRAEIINMPGNFDTINPLNAGETGYDRWGLYGLQVDEGPANGSAEVINMPGYGPFSGTKGYDRWGLYGLQEDEGSANGSEEFLIVNGRSGECMEVQDGTSDNRLLKMVTCDTTNSNQKFWIPNEYNLNGDRARIQNIGTSKYLGIGCNSGSSGDLVSGQPYDSCGHGDISVQHIGFDDSFIV